jgi:hypothetical protein
MKTETHHIALLLMCFLVELIFIPSIIFSTKAQAADPAPPQCAPPRPGLIGRLKDIKPSTKKTEQPPPPAPIPFSPAAAPGQPGPAGTSIEKRLETAGAKTGDIQISLAWNTSDDVDLHVEFTPHAPGALMSEINYRSRRGRYGGYLDVDMNAGGGQFSRTPVENIFWPRGSSPKGFFRVGAQLYASRTKRPVKITIRIKIGSDIKTINDVVVLGPTKIISNFQVP